MNSRHIVVAAAVLALVSACSSSAKPNPSPKDEESTISMLTGERLSAPPANPVYVVKIDNTDNSAPQTGLDAADLVVEEPVEGGLTRLAAFYSSKLPTQVGHVRSLRGTDIGIASPVKGVLVASGGAQVTIDKLAAAGIHMKTEGSGAAGFSVDPAKSAPYNRLVNLQELNAGAGPVKGQVPYLPWAASAAKATTSEQQVTSVQVKFSGAQLTRWQFANGVWQRTNGTAQPEFSAKNLLVLYAGQSDAGYLDPAGNPVPETDFEGTGKAVVFSGDRLLEGTWSKSGNASTISLRTSDGKDIRLAPGKAWIELVPKDSANVTWG